MENRPGAPAPPAEESVSRARDSAETAMTDVKQAARDVASTVKHAVKDETASVKEKAMGVIGDAQTKAADQTRTAATKLRETASGLDGELPWMKTALDKTAEGLERLNSALGSGDIEQILETTKDFARRQPALFLGLSVAAGFALARVGKTAIEASQPADTGMRESGDMVDMSDDMTTPYAPGTGV
jgi:ElaB/YqjD/DUF883 family membrane-anchored ribosome-binding protein